MSTIKTDGYPKEVWVVSMDGYWRPHKVTLTGETTRSWASGPSYCPHKWLKCKYRIIPEAEALEIEWVHQGRHRIAEAIEYGRHSAEQLRRVAEIIGYTEEPKP